MGICGLAHGTGEDLAAIDVAEDVLFEKFEEESLALAKPIDGWVHNGLSLKVLQVRHFVHIQYIVSGVECRMYPDTRSFNLPNIEVCYVVTFYTNLRFLRLLFIVW